MIFDPYQASINDSDTFQRMTVPGGGSVASGGGSPFAGLLSRMGGGAPAPAAPGAAPAPARAAPSGRPSFFSDSPGIFGMLASMGGAPTRAEYMAQQSGQTRSAAFQTIAALVEQNGGNVQKAVKDFINTPEGVAFMSDPNADPIAEIAQVTQALSAPQPDIKAFKPGDVLANSQTGEVVSTIPGGGEPATQTERATKILRDMGLMTPEREAKINAGAIDVVKVPDALGNEVWAVYDKVENTVTPMADLLRQQQTENNGGVPPTAVVEEPKPIETQPVATTNEPQSVEQQGQVVGLDPAVPEAQAKKPDYDIRTPNNKLTADIVDIMGAFPNIRDFAFNKIGAQVKGKIADPRLAALNSGWNTLRADLSALRASLSQEGRGEKLDMALIDDVLGGTSNFWKSPTDTVVKLLQVRDWLEQSRQNSEIIRTDTSNRTTREIRKQAQEDVYAYDRALQSFPDRKDLEAKYKSLRNSPGAFQQEFGKALGQLKQTEDAVGKVKNGVEGQPAQPEAGKTIEFKSVDDAKKAVQGGWTPQVGDTVIINGVPTKITE